MEMLKKGVANLRNGTQHAGGRLRASMKEKLAANPVHPGQLGAAMRDRIHDVARRHYEIAGRTIVQEKQLNEGGFAFVFLARDLHTDEEFVLKKIPCQDKATINMARREVEILQKLPPHPNLVRYYGHAIDKVDGNSQEVVLLFELCPGGHLLDLLESNQCKLSEAKILSVFSDVVTAVCLLHAWSPPIQHRDLKVENILLGPNGSFKLCDFGSWSDECSNTAEMDRQSISKLQENIERYTTMMYRPPEMVDFYQQFQVSEKVDIWMLGCILFTLMFCRQPFQDESTLAISNARYEMPQDAVYSGKLQDLTHWLLARDPDNRPSAGDVRDILASFDDGHALNLPAAVVDQKDRQRSSLYECGGADLDAPIRLPSKDRFDRGRKPKKSGLDGSSSSSKPEKKEKKERSKKDNLASWGDGSADKWPAVDVPQPSSSWAAFDSPSSVAERRPRPEELRDPNCAWTGWEQPLGHTTSAGSTSPAFQSDGAMPRESPKASGKSGCSKRGDRPRRKGSKADNGDAWPSWDEEAWPSSPGGHPSTNWDPFGNSQTPLPGPPQGAANAENSNGYSHVRIRSWPRTPESSWSQVASVRSEESLQSCRARASSPDYGRETAESRQGSSLWSVDGASRSSAARPDFRRSSTAPLQNMGEHSEWPHGDDFAGPVRGNSCSRLDVATFSSPRSPWDAPAAKSPTATPSKSPSGAHQADSQGPWAMPSRADPFDWLKSGSPMPTR